MEILTVVCGVGKRHEYVADKLSATLEPREPVGRNVGPEFPVVCKNCFRCEGVEEIRPCDYSTGNDLSPQDSFEKKAIENIPMQLREIISRNIDLSKIMDIAKEKGPVNSRDILDVVKAGIERRSRNDRNILFEENINNIIIAIRSVFPEQHTGLSNTLPQSQVVNEARDRAMHLADLFYRT